MASPTHTSHATPAARTYPRGTAGGGLFRFAPALLAASILCAPQSAWAQAAYAAEPNLPVAAPTVAAPSQLADANAAAVAPSWAHQGVLSTAAWGGRGLVHVASAYPLTRGAFTLTVRGDYFRARHLFLTGDTDTGANQSFHVAYSPVQGLELALGQESLANNYRGVLPRNLQLQGNPALRVKYGRHVAGPLALGALVTASLPTVQGGAGALLKSTSVTATGLVSLQPIERLEVMANVGYNYDRSRHVFVGEVPDVVQRFVFNINDVQTLRWGAGLTGRISLGKTVDLLPFAEVSGDVGFAKAANFKNSPLQASAGLRGYPTRNRAVELMVGSDARISGGPRPGSPFAGLPPWRAFAQITVHLGEGSGCTGPAPAAAPVARTFRIRGQAVDAETGHPVLGAALHVAGDEALLLFGADEQTGQFVSAPQPTGQGSLHLVARAPGYQPTEMDVARSSDGSDVTATVRLSPEAHGSKLALLKGNIKNAETGEAVVGAEIQVVALKRTLRSNRAGSFGALLKPGRYSVVVRAPGYEVQRKVLLLQAGESMVLNVDVSPQAP